MLNNMSGVMTKQKRYHKKPSKSGQRRVNGIMNKIKKDYKSSL